MAKISVMPSTVRKLPTSTPCCPWVGSTAVTKPSPICWAMTAPATCSADIVSRAVSAEHDADHDLLHHQHQQRRQRLHVDMVGVAVQRQDHRVSSSAIVSLMRTGMLDLAEARQQHHHRADAGEDQHEGGGERGQKGDVDAHDRRICRINRR